MISALDHQVVVSGALQIPQNRVIMR
jgi:hypothetical protein